MQRSTDRILTTHVGSLPRPAELDDALERRAEDEPAYAAVLKRAVADVVKGQIDVGLDVVNDGEFGKSAAARAVGVHQFGHLHRPLRLATRH